nr:hypothetical protein [Wolbachia endosymbiont (group A) of Volucella inflata]
MASLKFCPQSLLCQIKHHVTFLLSFLLLHLQDYEHLDLVLLVHLC